MKILHTSDWHLGHQLYSYERDQEQASMLKQIENLVREEMPDALLISGDLYHTAQPSARVQTMLTDAIVRIHKACPSMHIIITAGNHDSGVKHEIFRTPWEALNVYVVGNINVDCPQRQIIEVGDKGIVIAVPYVNSRNMPEGYYQQLIDLAEQSNDRNLPIVLMAHTTVAGLDWSGHEGANDNSVGGIDAVEIDDLGSGYDYVALGHIHHQQWVRGGKIRVRYSGSPLPVSFDENYSHTVSMVEIESKDAALTLREVEIDNKLPLFTLPLGDALPWNDVVELLKNTKPEREGTYLRLNVLVDDFLPPTANEEAQKISAELGYRFCYIHAVREERQKYETYSMTVDQLQRESPEEIAKRYCRDKNLTWNDELSQMFQEIVALVEEDMRGDK